MLYAPSTGGFYDRSIHGKNIPADAVEITCEQHQALLDGQAKGQRIVADDKGRPVLQDPPGPSAAERAAAARARRDSLLAESDWTQIADTPPTTKSKWKAYRKALRDVPQQPGFPDKIDWPVAPGVENSK